MVESVPNERGATRAVAQGATLDNPCVELLFGHKLRFTILTTTVLAVDGWFVLAEVRTFAATVPAAVGVVLSLSSFSRLFELVEACLVINL